MGDNVWVLVAADILATNEHRGPFLGEILGIDITDGNHDVAGFVDIAELLVGADARQSIGKSVGSLELSGNDKVSGVVFIAP